MDPMAGTERFRQIDRGLTRSGVGELDHRLACRNDLPWLGQRRYNHAIRIREQLGILRVVFRNLEMSLRSGKKGFCAV